MLQKVRKRWEQLAREDHPSPTICFDFRLVNKALSDLHPRSAQNLYIVFRLNPQMLKQNRRASQLAACSGNYIGKQLGKHIGNDFCNIA